MTSGFTKNVVETRETLLINAVTEEEVESYGSSLLGQEMPRSILYVPLDASGRAVGVVCLASFSAHARCTMRSETNTASGSTVKQ